MERMTMKEIDLLSISSLIRIVRLYRDSQNEMIIISTLKSNEIRDIVKKLKVYKDIKDKDSFRKLVTNGKTIYSDNITIKNNKIVFFA